MPVHHPRMHTLMNWDQADIIKLRLIAGRQLDRKLLFDE
jgi:hypothetical protein